MQAPGKRQSKEMSHCGYKGRLACLKQIETPCRRARLPFMQGRAIADRLSPHVRIHNDCGRLRSSRV